MTLCTAAGCPYEGRYCRIHKDEKPKKKQSLGRGNAPLDAWYKLKIRKCHWICEECGAPCYSTDPLYQRSAQAHLLPKSLYLSVATNEMNYACLGPGCGCHSRYDSNWANAAKMNIWRTSLNIIFHLIPFLSSEEYRRLPDIIADEYEASMFKQDRLDNIGLLNAGSNFC